MELVFDKKFIVEEKGEIPQEYYEKEKDHAVTLISLSIIRSLYENNLLTKEEFDYIHNKYML